MARNKLSGIYSITNLINNKVYIGQASYVWARISDHKHALKNNKHDNNYLQKAWNKYGEESFKFDLVEQVERLEDGKVNRIELTIREQYWMDFHKSYERDKGYNINPSAELNYMQGRTHTAEARKKISEAAKKRVLSEENLNKMNEARRNSPSTSRDKQDKVDYSLRELKPSKKPPSFTYCIKDLEGNEYSFTNLADFCRQHNLSRTHLNNMLIHNKYYKGWSGYKTPYIK